MVLKKKFNVFSMGADSGVGDAEIVARQIGRIALELAKPDALTLQWIREPARLLLDEPGNQRYLVWVCALDCVEGGGASTKTRAAHSWL
ncbi:hypothetical protein HF313_14070 [Massilia atriviolacea]|uniref:Uncharacterized protein n=1 Tax=Massilia atriviolacea TaxID=2495579 RepID=A0A430HQQ0_9BURK|nr:hypothetical protein EJB06_06605 [Massilia atriviolacea]